MAATVNTNIQSLNAQRNLTMSQTALSTAMQRLSSGLRINSAKDDAAGLAISERFTTQIRGLNQAARNANDGISLAQTGEGALAEITSNLQRIRELAVQSANATNSASDRAALDQEVQQRLAEVNRISSQTSFNGQKILDGTFGTAAFQIGANVGETISVGLSSSMKTVDIGSYVNVTSDQASVSAGTANATGTGTWASGAYQTGVGTYTGVDSNAIASGNLEINGVTVNPSADYAVDGDTLYRNDASAYAKAAAINASGISGVTATATTQITLDDNAVSDGMFLDSTANATGADALTYTLTINGETVINAATVDTDGITIDEAISAINSKQFDTGVVASKDENDQLILTAADGRNIVVGESFNFTDGATAASDTDAVVQTVFSTNTLADDGTASDDSGIITQAATYRGQVTLSSSDDVVINQGQAVIGFAATSYEASGQLEGQNVLSVDAANETILAVDSALTAVSSLRSTFGAIQNRFESTITNLATASENLSASRSRIQDADFAAETAALSRAQILQQASTAMVAQANQLPQGVLALLR